MKVAKGQCGRCWLWRQTPTVTEPNRQITTNSTGNPTIGTTKHNTDYNPSQTPAANPDRHIATDSSANLTTGTTMNNTELDPSQEPATTQSSKQVATDSRANPTPGTSKDDIGLHQEELLHDLSDVIMTFDGATASQF
ncbi:hypothetical protein OG21DRAFT_1527653 [Imleria badia]|nr:hypothetical protein OG21DRAFT_1527653 [Imleria badia]